MTDADVIAAIRAHHLKANIAYVETDAAVIVQWEEARIDPGGTIYGPGPYLKVPVMWGDGERTTHRVYAPARLRRKLAKAWQSGGDARI